MEEETEIPWWRTSLNIAGAVLGLLALAGLSMLLIIFVARVIDRVSLPSPGLPVQAENPPPALQNARTRVPDPYGLQPWPDSPARRPALGRIGASGSAQDGRPAGPAAQADVPVGVPVETYREAVASGKKLYIPNPQGACDLSGASTTKSAEALDECFAQRVAR